MAPPKLTASNPQVEAPVSGWALPFPEKKVLLTVNKVLRASTAPELSVKEHVLPSGDFGQVRLFRNRLEPAMYGVPSVPIRVSVISK